MEDSEEEMFLGIMVPLDYLNFLSLEEAVVLFYVETLLTTTAMVEKDNTIRREVLEEVLVELFPFLKNANKMISKLIKKDYLCIIESTDEVTLGAGILKL